MPLFFSAFLTMNQETLHLTNIQSDEEFKAIITAIDAMYAKNKPFWMLIETSQVRDIQPRYLFQISKYLNKIRNEYPRILQYSRIHVYDDFIFNLLYTLFIFLASPIAKVTVIYYEGGYPPITPITPTTSTQPIKKIKEYFPRR